MDALSPREIDVLKLAAEGLTCTEIGKELHIAHETAKDHLKHAYYKLSARNRAHAVALALRNGIIE